MERDKKLATLGHLRDLVDALAEKLDAAAKERKALAERMSAAVKELERDLRREIAAERVELNRRFDRPSDRVDSNTRIQHGYLSSPSH